MEIPELVITDKLREAEIDLDDDTRVRVTRVDNSDIFQVKIRRCIDGTMATRSGSATYTPSNRIPLNTIIKMLIEQVSKDPKEYEQDMRMFIPQ